MKDEQPRGFAGLNAGATKIAAELDAPPTTTTEQRPPPEKRAASVYTGQKAASKGNGVWWLILVGIVVAVAIFNESNGSGPSKSPVNPTPAVNPPSVQARPTNPSPPESSSRYAGIAEEKPPVGTGNILTAAQIRYCLSEKIRMTAWEAALNSYSKAAVDGFNLAVNDFNSRCSNYRYKAGLLESVRAEVESNRYLLERQGRAKASSK